MTQVSGASQMLSPQPMHSPQSSWQLAQVSLTSQVPSPQLGGQDPQSAGQSEQFSFQWQSPSPQLGGQ